MAEEEDEQTGEEPATLPPAGAALPAEEAAWLAEHVSRARVILEYGSGGSTRQAAAAGGKIVFSVESDPFWADQLCRQLKADGHAAGVHLHVVDIGPVGRWGRPTDSSGWRHYHAYPLSVWDRPDFRQPDLVLIDGRFRPACLMAVMARSRAPVTVLFDDYVGRARYHVVERIVAPSEIRGRMARFEIEPGAWPPEHLTTILGLFTRSF